MLAVWAVAASLENAFAGYAPECQAVNEAAHTRSKQPRNGEEKHGPYR